MKDIPLNERIIYALDLKTGEEAKYWVKRLESHICFYKVGLELFLADWFNIVDWIISRGHKVMLDLKFFDIPTTVGLAVSQLQKKKIFFATVHGNSSIIQGAVSSKRDLKLLAVTILTSFNQDDLREMGYKNNLEDLVLQRARKALELGCDGVVSSAGEALRLRAELGDDFYICTPGIRLNEYRQGREEDQKRVISAGQAIKNGADYLVIGRPIRDSKVPLDVVESLQHEISDATTETNAFDLKD
jgi:orotidine-5'-phosphate decarboxylase